MSLIQKAIYELLWPSVLKWVVVQNLSWKIDLHMNGFARRVILKAEAQGNSVMAYL